MNVDLELISQKFKNVEFFLACVFPSESPNFKGRADDISVVNSSQFWAVTSVSPFSRAGLAHKIHNDFIVFRGYEVAIGVHSYSPLSDLAKIIEPDQLENGVFSLLKLDEESQEATVKSDAFGMGPMFYREKNGAWFFASHPALIHLADDVPDLTSWASLLQNGYPFADRSFYEGIKRFPAGAEMLIAPGVCNIKHWFDFSELPEGTSEVNNEAIKKIERAYRNSMVRCLNLKVGSVILPFSSGFDSRRFFAFMVRNKIAFKAVTCQSFHRKRGRDYDIDSVYAPKIAAAFDVDCEVIPASSNEQFSADIRKRQNLIGTETFMHGWAMPLMKWLSEKEPSLVFDGLAGDVFGNSSFDIEGLEGSSNRTAGDIVQKAVKARILRHLAGSMKSARSYREKYEQYVAKFTPNMNQSQLAFLQARTRRSVAPWITMTHPPGHVIVFPYCDIEFARTALAYDPGQKYQRYLQRECLRRFYPEFYDFAGSRDLPADHAPIPEEISSSRHQIEEAHLYNDSSVVWAACRYLSFPNKVLLLAAKFIPKLRQHRDWIFRPILTLVRTSHQNVPYMNAATPARSEKRTVQFEPSIEMQIDGQS